MTKWDYKNGLPPLKKAKLGDEFEFISGEEVFKTNIDGFPYVVLDTDFEMLNKKDKFSIEGEQGMYTVTLVDIDRKTLEAKMDKVLDLTERTVKKVKDYYIGWGMIKEAERVKANYHWGYASAWVGVELCIEGKLSKNQVVQYNNDIVKIADLVKSEDGIVNIIGEHINREQVQPVYPYKESGEVKEWYEDMRDVYLKQAKSYMNKLEIGEIEV